MCPILKNLAVKIKNNNKMYRDYLKTSLTTDKLKEINRNSAIIKSQQSLE